MSESNKQEAEKPVFQLKAVSAILDAKEQKIKASFDYGKAYLLSLLIPPIGIYYFVKYVFFTDGEGENIRAGIISLVLTIVSFFISLWSVTSLLKQSSSLILPQDFEKLKDLASPENQKKLLELYK